MEAAEGARVRLVERPPPPPARARLVTRRDLRETALQAILFAGAALLPERAWAPLCRATSGVRLARHRQRQLPAFREAIAAVLGPEADAEAIHAAWREELHRRRLALFREAAGRGGGAAHRVLGREHLDAALAAGRGAILWPAPFLHQSLNGKRALAEAGILAHQASTADHGFLATRFGAAVLNPLVRRVEERFLAGRIRFPPPDPSGIGPALRAVLRAGGVLVSENNALAGRRLLLVPFGQGMALPMAAGPPRLALALGAPLLPCVTLALGPFGPCELRIGPDIAADAGADPLPVIARRARDAMLPALREAPAQFAAWPLLRPA
jgi:lauroyl/myristoyl acyltransferase